MKKIRCFISLFCVVFCGIKSFAQFTIPEVPKFQTSVYDYAGMLSDSEKTQLEQKLVRYSDSTSTQIVVITVENLKGEDVGVLATNWAQKWGIGGSQKNDNGVVMFFSLQDKKMSIRPGYGVEDKLIAGTLGEIIRKVIRPEFKNKNYFLGIDKGTDAIFEVLKGTYKGTRQGSKSDGIPIIYIILGLLVLFFIISKSKNNGSNGNRSGGFDLADIIILSSLGRNSGGGGFGGSSGGGGFGGGFGGGGFSGGGASGDW